MITVAMMADDEMVGRKEGDGFMDGLEHEFGRVPFCNVLVYMMMYFLCVCVCGVCSTISLIYICYLCLSCLRAVLRFSSSCTILSIIVGCHTR